MKKHQSAFKKTDTNSEITEEKKAVAPLIK
jgi:hypothetical protein